jgi:TPR repeat protein
MDGFPRIATATNGVPGFSKLEIPQINTEICTHGIIKMANEGSARHQNVVGAMYRAGVQMEQDDDTAVQWFLKAEEGSDSFEANNAKKNLLAMFLEGRGINPDSRSRALDILVETANAQSEDSAKASFRLGLIYAETEPNKAINYFIAAVGGKIPDALNQLVNLLYRHGIRSNAAAEYFKQAADEGQHCLAAFAYAEILSAKGHDEESLPYYKIAADQGHKLAEFKYLEHSNTWEKDPEIACKIGKVYLYGDKELGVLPDLTKARWCLIKAADNGHGLSAYLVAQLEKKLLMSMPENYCTAHASNKILEYSYIAYKANYLPAVLEARAKNDLSGKTAYQAYVLHRDGDTSLDLPPNEEKAKYYLSLAVGRHNKLAQQEFIKDLPKDHVANAELTRKFGSCINIRLAPLSPAIETNALNGKLEDSGNASYQDGLNCVETDPQKALNCFQDAVQKKVPDALNQLVNLLYRFGVSSKGAAEYFKQAADEEKHCLASFAYAEILSANRRNEESLHYYKIAADGGHKLAEFKHLEYSDAWRDAEIDFSWEKMNLAKLEFGITSNKREVSENAYKLGKAYLYGDKELGIPPDLKKAKHYLKSAADNGHGASAYLVFKLLVESLTVTYNPSSLGPFDERTSDEMMKYVRIAYGASYLPAVLEGKAGIAKDMESAFKLYSMYSEGAFLELPPDQEKAQYYLNMAVQGRYQPAVQEFIKGMPKDSPAHVECKRQLTNGSKTNNTSEKQKYNALRNKAFTQTELNPEDQYTFQKKLVSTLPPQLSSVSTTATTSTHL